MNDAVKKVVLAAAAAFERQHPYYREGLHSGTDETAETIRQALRAFAIDWTYGRQQQKARPIQRKRADK